MAKSKARDDDTIIDMSANEPQPVEAEQGPKSRAVCMLPSGRMLGVGGVEHWIDSFQSYSRRMPTDIVLPAIGFGGPWFDSEIHPAQASKAGLLPEWIRDARDLMPAANVWASVIFDFGFVGNSAIHQRTQFGDKLDQACPSNEATQTIVKGWLAEVLALGVDGVVIDFTDAMPNASAEGYVDVMAGCFCHQCIRLLKAEGFQADPTDFQGSNSLMKFFLRPDDDGTAHIDPQWEWIEGRDALSLVRRAINRRFILDSDDQANLEQAARGLEYFRARCFANAQSIRAMTEPIRLQGKRSALILGSQAADLSQMTALTPLSERMAADEYWLPDLLEPPEHASALQFLSARSTYNMNSFFEVIETSESILRLAGAQHLIGRILHTSKRLMSNQLSPGGCYVSESLPQYSGFVGVPLGGTDHLDIVQQAAQEADIPTLSPEVLDAIRIVDPNHSRD